MVYKTWVKAVVERAIVMSGYSLAATVGLAGAIAPSASAQQTLPVQIAPNPNPSNNTIKIGGNGLDPDFQGSVKNLENYTNNGRIFIDNGAFLTNESVFDNVGAIGGEFMTDIINNNVFNNVGYIGGYGLSIQNNGTFNNYENGNIRLEDALLENKDTLNNFGRIQVTESRDIVNAGTLNNAGSLDLYRAAGLSNSGILINTGQMNAYFSNIENLGYFQNDGLIAEEYEVAYLLNRGSFINNGDLNTLSLDANTGLFVNTGFHDTTGIDAEHYINNASGTILNNGSTIVTTDPDVIVVGFENSGLLKGSGSYTTISKEHPFLLAQGTVAPGGLFDSSLADNSNSTGRSAIADTAGTLTFNGDIHLESGLLDISIGGFEPDTYDTLNIVEGTVSLLGGSISLSLLNGFEISEALAPGETKELSFLKAEKGILDFSSQIDFSGLQAPGLSFDVLQQGNELVFSATKANATAEPPVKVPEPAVLVGMLLLSGFGLWQKCEIKNLNRGLNRANFKGVDL